MPDISNFGLINKAALEHSGNRPAIVDRTRGRNLVRTHLELDARMDRVALAIQRWGLRPGARVAVAMNNCAEFVEIVWGCMRAGVVAVPLNIRQGRAHLEGAARDAGFEAAFVEQASNASLAAVLADIPSDRTVHLFEQERGEAIHYESLPGPTGKEEILYASGKGLNCLLMYTSGSTGEPKGVPLTHDGQLWYELRNIELYGFSAADVALVALPMFHKNAMVGAVKPMLAAGGTMVILDGFDAPEMCRSVQAYRVTTITAVPTMVARLLGEPDLLRAHDFSTVRYLFVGSAPVTGQLLEQARGAIARQVFHMYGMTESVAVLGHVPDRTAPLSSCGFPFPGVELRLVGPSGSNEDVGELWIRSPANTPGYTNCPQLNAERFVDGWMQTGDIFSKSPDGFYTFLGRDDDMFVCGGENIYPKEVEALLQSSPDVQEACVVAIDHADKGKVPAAMVIPRNPGVTVQQLDAFCIANGSLNVRPRRILLTQALPLASTGKVDRKAVLAAILRNP